MTARERALKLAVLVGARPEFVKLAPLCRAISRHNSAGRQPEITDVVIHTGQHYDDNMSGIFFAELDLDPPSVDLGVGSAGHGEQTGEIMKRLEPVMLEQRPDGIVVFGDTNSTLSGALVGAKLHIPVVHIEAGLRSYNRRMPEEVNRVLTDHVSDLLFCPSDEALYNLRREGILDGVYVTGDINADALRWALPDDEEITEVLDSYGLERDRYVVATVHRAENTDELPRLHSILTAFEQLGARGLPVVMPVHPRTARLMASFSTEGIHLIEPIGHRRMVALMAGAVLGLTDSGGLQKELFWLGTPCVTLRDETEWVETVQVGWNVVAGTATDDILAAAEKMLAGPLPDRPEIYGNGRAAERMLEIMIDASTSDLAVSA